MVLAEAAGGVDAHARAVRVRLEQHPTLAGHWFVPGPAVP
jgi:hypothetical protein